MKLYIAEKPSLGRAIADALPKPHKKQQGYIEVANGDIVTWCVGHILEQAEPESYHEKYKKWQLNDLPIVPEKWQLKAKYKTKGQLAIIRKFSRQCNVIIHAGDPDREGQLLVDEVLDYINISQEKRKNTLRLLISDLNLPAVKKALKQLKPNTDFMPLSVSALARSRADWLYGINLTRAYTIQGNKVGYQGVLSVGRVQTPILGLVVYRDKEIEQFSSKDFYEVNAHITTPSNGSFIAKWQPSETCQPYMDHDGRVLVKPLAENVIARIKNQPAIVSQYQQQQKQQQAPLPYNLSALQIDAAKQFSMNAKLVLDVCQALYEKHKLITYPRSDCRYLPSEHLHQAGCILQSLSQGQIPYADAAKHADMAIKSKAFNSHKVGAHHAIVPTEKSSKNIKLNSFEKNIYGLIARQYIIQFYPPYRYHQTKISLTIAGGLFTAAANAPLQQGWKALFLSKEKQISEPDTHHQHDLPVVELGEQLHCSHGELLSKQTQPPKAFTDATLLAAMTGINRFVTDSELKSILKDTDGLGTEATRASIIELLFKRGFLERQGKQIHATAAGRGLIDALPEECSKPDMTAHWEASLNRIAEQNINYQSFIQPLTDKLYQLVQLASSQLPTSLQGIKSTVKPSFKKRRFRKKKAA